MQQQSDTVFEVVHQALLQLEAKNRALLLRLTRSCEEALRSSFDEFIILGTPEEIQLLSELGLCHGKQGKRISREILKVVREKYR
jgi:hypothetical protein